jgi:hypothetical protein
MVCGFKPDHDLLVMIEDWPAAPQGDCLVQHLKVWGDRNSNYAINEAISREQDREAGRGRFREIQMTKENQRLVQQLRMDVKRLQYNEGEEKQRRAPEELQYSEEEIAEVIHDRETEDIVNVGEEQARRKHEGSDDWDTESEEELKEKNPDQKRMDRSDWKRRMKQMSK